MLRASKEGDLGLVEYYIKMGIDPNYQHPEFLTVPLFESIRSGHLDIVQYLLENGADANLKEGFGTEMEGVNGKYYNEMEVMPYIDVVKDEVVQKELRLKTEEILRE